MNQSKNNNCLSSVSKRKFNSAHPREIHRKRKLSAYIVLRTCANECVLVMWQYFFTCACCSVQGCGLAQWKRSNSSYSMAQHCGRPESQKPQIDAARTSHRRTKAANPQHAFSITPQGRLPDSRPINPYRGTTWMTACLTTTKCQTISKGKQIEKKRCLGWDGIAVNITCE